MKKMKRFIILGLVCMFSFTCMSTGALAEINKSVTNKAIENARENGYTIVENMIDYSIYDADMIYIQERAELTETYNLLSNSRATIGTYTSWDWSNGIFSKTVGSASGYALGYCFTPVNNYLYFNVEVSGSTSNAPYMDVYKVSSTGSLTYVGSYNITSNGDGTYEWSNYRRTLTSGQAYTFKFWTVSGNWNSFYLDIYKTSM